MMPCDPDYLQVIKTSGADSTEEVYESLFKRGMQTYLFGFHILGTTGHVQLSLPMEDRLLSHLYLSMLPNTAISETLETLKNILLSHYNTIDHAFAELPLFEVKTRKAKINKKYERPEFSIETGA